MNNGSRSFTFDGVTITVAPLTWGGDITRVAIHNKLLRLLPPPEERDEYHEQLAIARSQFASLIAHTVSAEGLPYELPSASWPAGDLQASYEQFSSLPVDLIVGWVRLVEAVSAPVGERELAPPEQLTDGERNDPLSPNGG